MCNFPKVTKLISDRAKNLNLGPKSPNTAMYLLLVE